VTGPASQFDRGYDVYIAMRLLVPVEHPFNSIAEVRGMTLNEIYRYARYEDRFRAEMHQSRKHSKED